MIGERHALAPQHLPHFITAPGDGDGLMTLMAFLLVLGVLAAGVFYLTLHSLPERMAHRRHRAQFELIAVLGLLALVTHQNLFWVAALILALVELPDLATPARRAVDALERIAAGRVPGAEGTAEKPVERAEP